MKMKYGHANSNFRHGGYSSVDTCPEIKQSLARDLLRRVLTTPCDSHGSLPFTKEEQDWALGVVRRWNDGYQPEWCRELMIQLGFSRDNENTEI